MTAKNRAGLITKLHTSLQKHYQPAPAAPGRPLLEHILYAALLEDAPVDLADEGFAMCEQEFFDWNEVRVTSVTELAEVLSRFPSPTTTAARLKRCLQNVFETFYNFDIDHLKKENLGKAVAKFESMNGISPFVLAYLVQHGLGGHAIPVSSSAMHIMLKTGIVSDAEAKSGKVPGLERAIPKSKAIEFSSMLHQAAVALQADPTDKTVWEVIHSVNPDAQASAAKASPAARKEARQKAVKRAAAQAETEATGGEKSAGKASGKAEPKAKSKAATKGSSKTAAAEVTEPESAPPGAKSKSASGKSKAAAADVEPAAKKTTAKPNKKSASSKSASPKSTAGKGASNSADAAATEGEQAADETSTSNNAPAASGTGNQKLSKQKPR